MNNLKQLFYINKNAFTCQLVEKLCKEEGISCYTLSQVEDFSYLIDDLTPEVIVVTQQGVDLLGDLLFSSLDKSSHKSLLILMGDKEMERFHFTIPEVLGPQTFLQTINSLLGEYNKKH